MLLGVSGAVTLLIRTAAGDMYPPERRARGISLVLFGSVFGAILGPAVFGPLFSDKDVAASTLTVPWLAAAGLSLVACALVLFGAAGPEGDRGADLSAAAGPTRRPDGARRFARSCAARGCFPRCSPRSRASA